MTATVRRRDLDLNILLGGAIGGGLTALFSGFWKWRSRTAELDEAAKLNESNELRDFRKELRDEIHSLRTRINGMENELHIAQGQIIRQREYFVGVLYKLEGIITLKDGGLIAAGIQSLIEHMREFLDVMPIGGMEHADRKNLLEGK